ncbi:hypothetical protein Csa_023521, partial [Cucumis sativus]
QITEFIGRRISRFHKPSKDNHPGESATCLTKPTATQGKKAAPNPQV